jgi:hypothetical protein
MEWMELMASSKAMETLKRFSKTILALPAALSNVATCAEFSRRWGFSCKNLVQITYSMTLPFAKIVIG